MSRDHVIFLAFPFELSTRREFKWIEKSVFKKSGMVAPVSRSEIDERLADFHKTQCIIYESYV